MKVEESWVCCPPAAGGRSQPRQPRPAFPFLSPAPSLASSPSLPPSYQAPTSHCVLAPPSAMDVTDASAHAPEKRKRSPSASAAPPAKVSKTGGGHQLSINYLSRHSQEDLPLLNKDDTLPNLLHLLTAYSNVLDRHESLASNLGARPLAPILIKRFERCFDAPPKIVASHHKGSSTNPEDSAHTITWLEVIEFARSHPSQFTLSTFSEGRRVCQFYYPQKQLRVQVNEDDFLFINSGRCQELIPPLPIWEDEEKEVGTCDVLEAKLRELTNAADMVAARTRQLSHRLKGRRAAILDRRAEGGSGTPAKAAPSQTTTAPPASSGSGFVAVNSGSNGAQNGDTDLASGSWTSVRSDLLRHFESLPHNQNITRPSSRHLSVANHADGTQSGTRPYDMNIADQVDAADRVASATPSLSPIPVSAFPNDVSYYTTEGSSATQQPTPSGHRSSASGFGYGSGHAPIKHNFSRPLPQALESAQPFRPLCQAHMDSLPRGHRVIPPCDRCRRLRMDCVKNLTSCAGCTKKHARCHWKDVSRDELGDLDHLMDSDYPASADQNTQTNGYGNGMSDGGDMDAEESDDDDSNPLEDLEALGERVDQREKELAERMREDEEGLRNAKELARQGRENGGTTATSAQQDQAGTNPQENVAASTPHDDEIVNKATTANQPPTNGSTAGSSADKNSDVEPETAQSRQQQLPSPDSRMDKSTASLSPFVALPSQQPFPSGHGSGFQAVNVSGMPNGRHV